MMPIKPRSRLRFGLGPLTSAGLLSLAAACGGSEDDGGGEACAAALLPGDLVITELMANPPGMDDGFEWWEIYNPTGESMDLAGVSLVFSRIDGSREKSHEIDALTIEPDQYLVVGDAENEADIVPSHVDYGYAGAIGLTNTAGRLALVCGETTVDEMLYEDTLDGASRAYDGRRIPDATGNDDLTAWCDSTAEYAADQLGSPGAPNEACGGGSAPTTCEENGIVRDVLAPEVGDLVITELHPNPAAVADESGEWFEVHVLETIDLNGLQIGRTVGEADDTVTDTACVVAQAGSYVVFARALDPAVNGGLPIADHPFDFSLTNSSGNLFIGRDGEVLDEIGWSSSFDGASRNLDPDRLGADLNDDESGWCEAIAPYGDGDLGTPGGPNIACDIPPPDGMCLDGETLVPVLTPSPGDLVITEFMSNPEAVPDDTGEWFEIRANAAFHLNGLELGSMPGDVKQTIDAQACLLLEAGSHALLARSPDSPANGDLPAVDASFDFALTNGASGLFISTGGTLLDAITWSSTSAGAATSLDPSSADPTENDDPTNWCAAVDAYGAGDLGTPGAENPSCGGSISGMCLDGGNERRIVSPEAGDLVITELMPDPSAVTDANGEWFEVLVTADVDLNGLEIGVTPGDVDATLPAGGECLSASTGSRIVFARSDDALVNGGVDPVFATFGFNLVNDDGGVFVGLGGALLDAVSYTSSNTGASTSLDPASEDPVSNDDPVNFCAATTPYGAGDLGSPGAANETCN